MSVCSCLRACMRVCVLEQRHSPGAKHYCKIHPGKERGALWACINCGKPSLQVWAPLTALLKGFWPTRQVSSQCMSLA